MQLCEPIFLSIQHKDGEDAVKSPVLHEHGHQQCGQFCFVSRVNGDIPTLQIRPPQKQLGGPRTQHHFQIQRQGL